MGIINLKLQAGSNEASALGESHTNFTSTTRPALVATVDLTTEQWARMIAVAEVNCTTYEGNKTLARQFNAERGTGFLDLRLFDLPNTKCMISGLRLTCSLYDLDGNWVQKFTFIAETNGHPLTIQHKYHWTSYNRTQEWSVQTYGRFDLS